MRYTIFSNVDVDNDLVNKFARLLTVNLFNLNLSTFLEFMSIENFGEICLVLSPLIYYLLTCATQATLSS